jgi:hypothetical protein
LFNSITGIAGYYHIKEIKYLNNDHSLKGGSPHFLFYFKGNKNFKKEKKRKKKSSLKRQKEVACTTTKKNCSRIRGSNGGSNWVKKTAVELGDRTGDRIGSLTFFCVS